MNIKNWKWFSWLGALLFVIGIVCVVLGAITSVSGELIAGILVVISSFSLITYRKQDKKEKDNNPKSQ
jgi:uncharacterized membrane protein HdeD (DUF308 family)